MMNEPRMRGGFVVCPECDGLLAEHLDSCSRLEPNEALERAAVIQEGGLHGNMTVLNLERAGWEVRRVTSDSLDAAWAEAEAAIESADADCDAHLTMHWAKAELSMEGYEPEAWIAEVKLRDLRSPCACCGQPFGGPRYVKAEGPTPAAALRALTAKLRGEG